MEQTGFKNQKHISFARFQGCFSQTWILVFLILLTLILLILKLKKVLVNLGKITKWSISLANFYFGYLKGACFKYGLYFFLILCIIEVLGKFGQEVKNDSLEQKISILVLVSQIMVFHFVYFEHKKDFWHILVKFVVHRVSLLSIRSN